MRVAPIGLAFWRDLAALLETAHASSLLTHGHDAAVESAAAAALLVALALEKRTPAEMYAALVEECAPRPQDLAHRLGQGRALVDADAEVALSTCVLGEGWATAPSPPSGSST